MEKAERIIKVFETAMHEAWEILRKDVNESDDEKIHEVKSWMYVAIERLGMKAEKLAETQQLLRKLLAILNLRGAMKENERKEGLRILGQLMKQGMPLRQIRFPKNAEILAAGS